jgi:hypothetical protein
MPGLTNDDNETLVNGLNEEINGYNLHSSAVSDDVPVLVAGGGPAGLLMSYMLSKFGSKNAMEFKGVLLTNL